MGVDHVVAGGDLNERPGGGPSNGWPKGCRTAGPPCPGQRIHLDARQPFQRIDAIFATPGIEVLGCGVPLEQPGVEEADLRTATDHFPVLAALRVPAA